MAQRTVGKIEPIPKIWLSKTEAMAYLGCSERFLETLRNKAEIRFSRYGRTFWYELESINQFFRKHKVV